MADEKIITYESTGDYSNGTGSDIVIASDKIVLDSYQTATPELSLDDLCNTSLPGGGKLYRTVIMGAYIYTIAGNYIAKVRASDMAPISNVSFSGTYAGFADITTDGTYLYAVSTNGGGGVSDQDFLWKFDADLTQIGTKKQFYTDGHTDWGGLRVCKYIGGKIWIFGNNHLFVINTDITWGNVYDWAYSFYYSSIMREDGLYCFVAAYQCVVKVLISDPSSQTPTTTSISGATITDLHKYGDKYICRVSYGVEEIRFLDPSNMTWSASGRATPSRDFTDNQNPWNAKMNLDGDRLFVGWATDWLNSLLIQYDLTTDPVTYVGQLQLGIHGVYLADECGIHDIERYTDEIGDYLIIDYINPNSSTSSLRKICIATYATDYYTSGSFEDSINIHIDGDIVKASLVEFTNTLLAGTTAKVYGRISPTGAWIEISSGGTFLPSIVYKDIQNDPTNLYWKVELATTDSKKTPEFNGIIFTITGTSPYGSANFTSDPTGANVTIGGIDKGPAPFTESFYYGQYEATYELAEYWPQNKLFTILPGETIDVAVVLLSTIPAPTYLPNQIFINKAPIRLFSKTMEFLAEFEKYASLQYVRSFFGIGEFKFIMDYTIDLANLIERDQKIMIDNNPNKVGIIDNYKRITKENSDELEITGHELKILTKRRTIQPLSGQASYTYTGNLETIAKNLIYDQMGQGAATERIIQRLKIALNQGRGAQTTIDEKLNSFCDAVICNLCQASNEYGWIIRLDLNDKAQPYEMDIIAGRDQTKSVIWARETKTIKEGELIDTDLNYKNVAIIGGQGEGTGRKIRTVGNAQDEERFEIFIDAQNLATDSELDAMGAQSLANLNTTKYMKGRPITDGAFSYGTDWDLGDLVSIQLFGLVLTPRIIAIREIYEPGTYRMEVSFDRELPNFFAQVPLKFAAIDKSLNFREK